MGMEGGNRCGFKLIPAWLQQIAKFGHNHPLGKETPAQENMRLFTLTAFLVVRITFGSGNDTVDLFVNPTPGQPLPAVPVPKDAVALSVR